MNSTLETLKEIKEFLKTGTGTEKVKKWVSRHKPESRGGVLFIRGKPVIPQESVTKTLLKVGKRGMPMTTHKAAWEWVKARFVGILQKDVSAFLNAHRAFKKKELRKYENINRYVITDKMLHDIHEGLSGKVVDLRTAAFLKTFPGLENRRGTLFFGEKQLISTEQLPKILNDELVSGGCPMSCEAAYNYLRNKYIGALTRRKVSEFIKSLESWQLSKPRPPNPDQIRATYKNQYEGTTRFLLAPGSGGNWNALSSDLMYCPKQWSKFKFFLCVVHMRSGYCWFEPLVERKSKNLIAPFKRILKDAEERFGGKVKMLQTDGGVEYLNFFAKYLKSVGIKHVNDHKSYHCERKIGQFGRTFGHLLGIGVQFAEALVLAVQKLNNTKSRITGKQPREVGTRDKLKKPRKNRKGKRKQKPLEEFAVSDKVRFQKKNADIMNGFYKSYGSTSRKPKHENWSHSTPKIIEKKTVRGTKLYKLENETKWRKGWTLQKVTKVRTLEVPKEKLKKSLDVRRKIAEITQKKPKVRVEKQMKALEPDLGSYWKPVTGRRRRKRVHYKE